MLAKIGMDGCRLDVEVVVTVAGLGQDRVMIVDSLN